MSQFHELPFGGRRPFVHPDAFVAPTAVLIGDVRVEADASVWYGAVLRADLDAIVVGAQSNVQDNCVLHTATGCPTVLGQRVTIGHASVLEGCDIGANALIGTGSVVLNRATVGQGAMLAAGTVVPQDMDVPAGVLAAGVPAVVKRELSGNAAEWVDMAAAEYLRLRERYMTDVHPRRRA